MMTQMGRTETATDDPPDRLSQLPDLLLLKILSSLEMKYVVRTGILSKRWKNLWTRADHLVYTFHIDVFTPVDPEPFESFVDTTLRQHQSNIHRFSLSAHWNYDDDTNDVVYEMVDEWLERVFRKNVEVLELRVEGVSYSLPDFVFHSSASSSLTKMTLQSMIIDELSAPVKWNSLKSLWLKNMTLSDQVMGNILVGSPVLEFLSVESSDQLGLHNITSRTLRKLIVDDSYGNRDYDNERDSAYDPTFIIRAPCVQELQISGRFFVTECQIEDMTSLVKATLTFTARHESHDHGRYQKDIDSEMEFNGKWVDMVPDVLKAVSHVAELSIGTEIIQVLSMAKSSGKPCPSFQCKHLTINSPLWSYDVLGISCLLESVPHLETLVINVSDYQDTSPLHKRIKPRDDADMDLSLPDGNLEHLKIVKIDYFRNPCTDNPASVGEKCNDVEIVGYIMRSAVALERLVLCSSRPGCTRPGCSKADCSFQYVPRLSGELLSNFMPGNEAGEWELKKRNFSYEYSFSNYASLHSEVASKEASS